MAIVKAVSSRASIGKAIDYVSKDEKTEEKLISGIGCNPTSAKEEMQVTKEIWGKTEGRQYKHFVHSFQPGEVTPGQAHEMAKQLCQDRFKGHEVLIATHRDKEHIHSHIIVNSVNYEDGHKLQWSKKDLQAMKDRCNEISLEMGLSVPTKSQEVTDWSLGKHKALERAFEGDYKSHLLDIANEVADARQSARTRTEFVDLLREKGIDTEWKDNHKHITFKDKDGNKVRNTNLTKTFKADFGKESLEDEFQHNAQRAGAREQLKGFGTYKGAVGEASGSRITNTDVAVYGAVAEQINREFEERAERAEREKRAVLERKTESERVEPPKEPKRTRTRDRGIER